MSVGVKHKNTPDPAFVWLHGFHLFHARHKRSPCCLSSRRRRPDKTVSVHLHLAGALLFLHLSFLLSSCWVLVLNVADEDWICKGLGLFLHWSLMATFLWMAVEGFHLYLLLVRVFNIYINRYVLKLSLVAWGEGIVPSIQDTSYSLLCFLLKWLKFSSGFAFKSSWRLFCASFVLAQDCQRWPWCSVWALMFMVNTQFNWKVTTATTQLCSCKMLELRGWMPGLLLSELNQLPFPQMLDKQPVPTGPVDQLHHYHGLHLPGGTI